jgi:hypothetical protein
MDKRYQATYLFADRSAGAMESEHYGDLAVMLAIINAPIFTVYERTIDPDSGAKRMKVLVRQGYHGS